jgi:quinol monooxygenase YgiN
MTTLVTNELFAQPGRGEDVARLLLEILGESLQHAGCQTIRILRDQDDPDHVTGLTQWTERRNFEDYLAWRTQRGFTGAFEAMLTRPFVIHYYDIAYFGGTSRPVRAVRLSGAGGHPPGVPVPGRTSTGQARWGTGVWTSADRA